MRRRSLLGHCCLATQRRKPALPATYAHPIRPCPALRGIWDRSGWGHARVPDQLVAHHPAAHAAAHAATNAAADNAPEAAGGHRPKAT